jgi:exodeoxyribonuclease VII small subunit
MEELQSIVGDLERDDVDIDVLSTKVRRAFELIEFCRSRISATELEISQVVAALEREDPD